MELWFLFTVFAALQVADVWTTWRILLDGGRELNPVMNYLITKAGLVPGLIAGKVAMLFVLGYFILVGQMNVPFLGVCSLFYVIVVSHNILQIRKKNGARSG